MVVKSVLFLLFLFLVQTASSLAPEIAPEEIKNPPPKIIRTCCAFGADIGYTGVPFAKRNDITSIDAIGPHKYLGQKEENNGIVYTLRGGFIDMGHLRDCADWTAYLYKLILYNLEGTGPNVVHTGYEGGPKSLHLKLPENLTSDDALELAAKIAYDISVWHEISTWFGASYVPMVPERYSSFSPEDLYSNLLGTHLAVEAIKSDLEYNQAMTLAIERMLKNLEVVSTWEESYEAMVKVDKLWYDGDKRFPSGKIILRRFLDTEEALTPWLVPGEKSFLPPYILSKPDKSLAQYYEFQIRLNFKFPKKSLAEDLNERLITQNDFPVLIKHIQREITEKELKEEDRREKHKKNGKGDEVYSGE